MTIIKRDDSANPFDDAAYLTLCKREFSAEERRKAESSGAAMPGGRYPIENGADLQNAIHAVGRGKGSHAAIRRHIIARAKALGLSDKIPDDWKAKKRELLANVSTDDAVTAFGKRLQVLKDELTVYDFNAAQIDAEAREYAQDMLCEIDEAVCSLRTAFMEIGASPDIADKATALKQSVEQFKEHIQGIVPEGVENAMAALALAEAGFELTEGGALTKRDEDHMPFDLKKSLGLPATATDAEVEKAFQDREADGSFGRLVAKMSPEHLAYMVHKDAKLPEGGQHAFAALAVDKRDAHVKANPLPVEKAKGKKSQTADEDEEDKEDDVMKIDGVTIRKSVIGADQFQILKSQHDRIEKMEDERRLGDIVKRVEPLKHIGKSDEIGGLIHRISKRDAKDGEAVEAVLKRLDAVIGKSALLTESGSSISGRVGKASDEIEALAKQKVSANKGMSIYKARSLVRDERPDLAKEETIERKPRAA